MLTTGVDPFTQIYQAVIAQLKVYPGVQGTPLPAAAGGGNGLFATIMDMTDPSFQTLLRMGSGDTPALRVQSNIAEAKPYGANSFTGDFEQDLDLFVTTDFLNQVPINQASWILFVALSKLPQHLGLPGLVRRWTCFQSRQAWYQPKKAQQYGEVDAAGSWRWAYALSMRVNGYVDSIALQETYPTIVPGT